MPEERAEGAYVSWEYAAPDIALFTVERVCGDGSVVKMILTVEEAAGAVNQLRRYIQDAYPEAALGSEIVKRAVYPY